MPSLVAAGFGSATAQTIRPERFYDPTRQLTYRVIQGSLNGYHSITWSQAYAFAALHNDAVLGRPIGFGLVRIVDEHENDFITSIIRSFPLCSGGQADCNPEMWIGLSATTCCSTPGCFAWTDGAGPQQFAAWAPGEPGCSDCAGTGNPYYVIVNSAGLWNNTGNTAGLCYNNHSFWGLMKFPCDNTISQHPRSTTTCPGATVTLQIAAAGSPPFNYLWEREVFPPGSGVFVPLVDGPTGSGSTISGAATMALEISRVALPDASRYRALVTNPCGTVASYACTFAVCQFDEDFDCDGDVDQDDVDTVLFNYADSVPPGELGDVDGDGFVTQDDLDLVLFRFGTSCS